MILHRTLRFTSFLFCGLGLAVSFAQAEELASTGKILAETYDGIGCNSSMPIMLTADDPNAFVTHSPELREVIAKAANVLSKRCPQLETISIDGEANFSSLFEAKAKKSANWKPEIVRGYTKGQSVTEQLQAIFPSASSSPAKPGSAGPAGVGAKDPFSQFNKLKPTNPTTTPQGQSGMLQGGNLTASGYFDASQYQRPDIIQNLYSHDMNALKANKAVSYLYVVSIINELKEGALWRAGPEFEVLLDPHLPVQAELKLMTDPTLMTGVVTPGLDALVQGFKGFAKERQRAVNEGSLRPVQEMQGLLGGILKGTKPIHLVKVDGEHDAKRLTLLAQSDFASFKRIYNGIRTFIYGL